MKLSPSERRTLTLVGLGFILLLGFALGLKPFLAGDDPRLQKQVEEAADFLGQAQAIRARHAQLAGVAAEMEQQFLSDTEAAQGAVSLLRLVEQTAGQAGLTLQTKAIRPLSPDEKPVKVRVDVAGTGEPVAAIDFLRILGAGRYRVDVESLDLAVGQEHSLELRAQIAALLPRAQGGSGQ